jgi:hypothetical protein
MIKSGLSGKSIELLSLGDKIHNGLYKIHSRFRYAINFVNGNELVSLVNEKGGAGPINIVVKGLDFLKVNSLCIDKKFILINDYKLDIMTSIIYNSEVCLKDININRLEENINTFEKILLNLSSSKSLTFLLNNERKMDFNSRFGTEFAKNIDTGVREIFDGDLRNGIRMIKGTGFGLTPGGDDFIAGLLSGLYLIQNINGKDLSEVREMIYETAKGRNLISNTFLYFAKEGLFFERFRDLLFSFYTKGKVRFVKVLKDFFRLGKPQEQI